MSYLEPQPFCEGITIRVCNPDDAPLFLKFAETIAAETTHTLQLPGAKINVEKLRSRWMQAKADPNICYLGAFGRGNMLGQIFFERESSTHPWIRHNAEFAMYVVKEHWGSGLSKALLKQAIEHLKNSGVRRLEATVRAENKRGISFYKKFGFEIEGVRKSSAFVNGSFQDELYIALLI